MAKRNPPESLDRLTSPPQYRLFFINFYHHHLDYECHLSARQMVEIQNASQRNCEYGFWYYVVVYIRISSSRNLIHDQLIRLPAYGIVKQPPIALNSNGGIERKT